MISIKLLHHRSNVVLTLYQTIKAQVKQFETLKLHLQFLLTFQHILQTSQHILADVAPLYRIPCLSLLLKYSTLSLIRPRQYSHFTTTLRIWKWGHSTYILYFNSQFQSLRLSKLPVFLPDKQLTKYETKKKKHD